jgi:hypothetical protein
VRDEAPARSRQSLGQTENSLSRVWVWEPLSVLQGQGATVQAQPARLLVSSTSVGI